MNLTKQQKEVLHHAIDNGWDTIEGQSFENGWEDITNFSLRNIFQGIIQLRIKQVPDSINWEHVSSEICGMARDEDERVFLYKNPPRLLKNCWLLDIGNGEYPAHIFSSYKQGTVDWKDSWVPNPFHKDNQVKIEDSQK